MTGAITVFERADGWVRARLLADPCSACDAALDGWGFGQDPGPGEVPEDGVQVAHTRCPDHRVSVLVADPERRLSLLVRGRRDDSGWQRDAWLLLAAAVGGADDLDHARRVARKALDVVADPAAWMVDESVHPALVEEAVGRAVNWATSGNTPVAMRRWTEAGVREPWLARGWNSAGFSHLEAGEYIAKGTVSAVSASNWYSMGVDPSSAPREFADDPLAWAFVVEAGVVLRDMDWGSLVHDVTPRFAKIGYQYGQSAMAVRALGRALGAPVPERRQHLRTKFTVGRFVFYGPWDPAAAGDIEGIATAVGSLDWAKVALCIEAGMGWPEAAQYVGDGGDMRPVRVMAGLNS